jgi:hypothetical protein
VCDCHNPIATRLRDVAVQYVESQSADGRAPAAVAEEAAAVDNVVEEEDDGTVVIEL